MPTSTRTTRPRTALVAAALLPAALLAACGSDTDESGSASSSTTEEGGAAQADGATVEIERSRYLPEELVVEAGTTVVFDNLDPVAHSVTASEGDELDFDSGLFGSSTDAGTTFERTYDDPGSYDYFCTVHPTMRGTIVVE